MNWWKSKRCGTTAFRAKSAVSNWCSYNIPRGNLAAYYPETNPLVPMSSFGDQTHTPTSKAVPVTIRRCEQTVDLQRIA